MMSECIFCDIVAGDAPSHTVYEDHTAIAFLDIMPATPGHTLVVPKQHFAHLADLDEETGAHLFKVGMRTAQAIRESGVQCEGINLHLSDGRAAGQVVFHVHLHVIPRFAGDPVRIHRGSGERASNSELEAVAGKIRGAYEQ